MRYIRVIFVFIIFCWIILSFFNIAYNANKTFSEIKEWAFLSDYEKRNKMFGNIYNFLVFIKDRTPNDAQILLFAQDVRVRYLSMYFLYPRTVITTQDKKEFVKMITNKKFDYIAEYNSQLPIKDYINIASFSSQKSTDYGVLYKIK